MRKNLVCLALIVSAALASGCASIDFDYPRSESTALSDTGDTCLGRKLESPVTGHASDESGFYLLSDGIDSLAMRLLLARRAEYPRGISRRARQAALA